MTAPKRTASFKYSKRQRCERLRAQLENDRQSFMSDWKDVGDFILSSRPRFTLSDTNRGGRRNQRIVNNTATLAMRTLRAGMMSGITSPARRWFRLSTSSTKLNESGPVKQWLYDVAEIINDIYLKSNLYNCLPTLYGDLGGFGVAAMFVEEDFEKVLRFFPIEIGSYMIANDHQLKVNTFIREFRLTVDQVVEKFARQGDGSIVWDKISLRVKNLWEDNNGQQWVDIIHAVYPNENYDAQKTGSEFLQFSSVYYEKGTQAASTFNSAGEDVLLSDKGYDYFPVLVPRWETNGTDVYSTSYPGIDAIGDVKQLQHGEKKIMKAIDKQVDPPMVAPIAMRNSRSSIIAGDVTYVDVREGQQGYRAAHEVNLRVDMAEAKQDKVAARIQRAFYEDLFLMLAQSDRRQITATEIDERREEKLLALGPVLEQLNSDLLQRLIDIAFEIGMRQRLFPDAPEELSGQPLKVEFISVMAQAQKFVGIAGIERFVNFAIGIVNIDDTAKAKLNTFEMLNTYSESVSIAPNMVRTDEEANGILAQAAQAQQAQQQSQMIAQGAQAAKNAAGADMSGDNALTRLMNDANAGSLLPQR